MFEAKFSRIIFRSKQKKTFYLVRMYRTEGPFSAADPLTGMTVGRYERILLAEETMGGDGPPTAQALIDAVKIKMKDKNAQENSKFKDEDIFVTLGLSEHEAGKQK